MRFNSFLSFYVDINRFIPFWMGNMNKIKSQFDPIFYPENVAIVGASPNIYKWGNFLMASMIKCGYKGAIFPVNKKEKTILGRECYKSLLDINENIDLAVVAVPVAHCETIVDQCVEKGVGGMVLITSGFSEVGEQGKEIESRIANKVKAAGIRMIGPNTMGLINTHHSLAFTASQVRPPTGYISMISQSGNLGDQVVNWAENMGIGISKFIGSGNEADVGMVDLLKYLHQDKTTKVILVYFESVHQGRRLVDVASKVSKDKPVIALKGGRTQGGSKAAASHTGSLAGQREVSLGALQQAGVIIAKNPTELIDFSVAFEHLPLPKGNRVGILTLGGGWGVIASDECNERGFELPDLPQNVIDELSKHLPAYWSKQNPIDLVGTFDARLYGNAISSLAECGEFDAVLALGGLGASQFIIRLVTAARAIDPSFDVNIVQTAISKAAKLEATQLRYIGKAIQKYNLPVLTVSHAEKLNYAIPIDNNMVVAYPTPEKAIRVLQAMLWYGNWKRSRS